MRNNSSNRPGHPVQTEHTVQEYLAVVVREKWTILTVFCVVLIGTIIFTQLSKPVYKATTQVLLNRAELRSALFLDQGRTDRAETIVQNELAVLNSRVLADSVAARMREVRYVDAERTTPLPIVLPASAPQGVDTMATLDEISGRVSGSVDFDPVRESDLINITAQSRNPHEAALLANTFAEAYRDRNIYMSRAKSRGFREFLESQAREKRRQLEETEGSLQQYMQKEGIVSLDDEAKKVIDQLAQLEANRDATDIALRQLQNQLASYKDQLPQQETNVARVIGEATDPYIRLLQEQIAKLEVQKDVTVVQNPSSVGREILNEKVREIDNQINALRLKLQKRTDEFLQSLAPSQSGGGQGDAAGYLRTVKQKIIESQIEVQSLVAKKKALEDVIRQYEGQFERIPRKSVQLARLQRSRLSNEKLYLMVEEKFNEANITEKSNIGYIEVVEPAAPPSRPSSPRVFVNLAIGIVFGLVFGLAVAFVKEFIDVRIHAPEDLKRRGFLPLVTIKNIEEEVTRLGGPRKTGEATDDLARQLITVSYPFSSVAESFRQLRTSLQYGKHGETISTILVTSPTPGEGKTTTVSNLAVAFAQAGKKVLLVDGDLRRPTVDDKFGARKEPGIAEYLAGKATLHAVVQRTAVEHLSVVACGALPPNPAEILGSKKMKEFLEQAKKEFEVILFDSSPVLAVTDPSVLSTVADGTILVVSASRTRMDELQQASEMLESVGGKVFGVAINNFDVKRAYGISPRRARSGGYGYGRVYGDERRAAEEAPEEKAPTTTS